MIAEDHLNETTKVMIQSLIGNSHLYSIGSWADEIRRDNPNTAPWHYVNIPFGRKYDAHRDCSLPNSCVVAKIADLQKILMQQEASREARVEALKFIVHLVADIHQPMHAAGELRGGNGVHVRFLDGERCGPDPCNLHSVWDSSMIEHVGMGRDEYTRHEEELIKAEKLDTQAGGNPEQWANESLDLAHSAFVPDGTHLDERYYSQQIKVVDKQLALGGLRLAKLLNESIGKMTPRDFSPSVESSVTEQGVVPQNVQGSTSSVKVWVNTKSGTYHCPDTRWYGGTKQGEYMRESEAAKDGYHPAGGKSCQAP